MTIWKSRLQCVSLGFCVGLMVGCTSSDDDGNRINKDAGDVEVNNCTGINMTPHIVPDTKNWVDACSNPVGIQGSLYTYTDGAGSTIEVINQGNGVLCVSGAGAEVPDTSQSSYSTYWGCGVGIDICAPDSENPNVVAPDNGNTTVQPLAIDTPNLATPMDTDTAASGSNNGTGKTTISECSRNISSIAGVRMMISGQLPEHELRVNFEERGAQSSYVVVDPTAIVDGNGVPVAVDYWMKDASVKWDTSLPPMVPGNVVGIQLQVATKTGGPVPFNFCFQNIEILTAANLPQDTDSAPNGGGNTANFK
jgi:hypothetical protein